MTRQKYNTTMGTPMKMEPDAKRANSVSSRYMSPTATVQLSMVGNNSLGRMKSLHGQVKDVSAAYTKIGLDRGKMIFKNT